MNIYEAMQARTREKPFLTRVAWKSVLTELTDRAYLVIHIQPTDTPERCLFYGPSKEIPRRGWQPLAEDLLADDWETTAGF